ncbi:hypothetical protein [Oscillatoria acuminata]|uniref:Uncharacterized protein n=1 Tax=Oscillatoria acuminata PCC 6304 TaxID=56110 RepID=K9TEX5_9CYAN|nr:hypothetical protein [Oscillatoria acuminata]AFY81090.1 hypothetical protein Oscil6304_1383 [Oscillatoria acuminata PCC 6304]
MDSQESITPLVYAPNLHLFAFHLCRGLTGEPDSQVRDPQLLWERADAMLETLGFSERLHLYGYSTPSPEPPGTEVNLHPNNQLKLQRKFPNSELEITGRMLAYRLYDSYSLIVNFRRPEREKGEKTSEVPISIWRDWTSEKGIFLPDFVQSSLGQTLVLTAFLSKEDTDKSPEELEEFAYRCLRQLIPAKKDRPPLERVGEVFGSPIFEFGGQILDSHLQEEPDPNCHVLVWLFREDLPSAKFIDSYRQFIDLFYYRNKALSAYRETRTLYRKIYDVYTELEKNVKDFKRELLKQPTPNQRLSEAQLEPLKEVLKNLSQLDLEYARLLRNYKHNRNTIAIHAKNYTVILENILRKLKEEKHPVQREELDFFREFCDRTCPYFQTRIADELNYFIEGSSLADKAIASIRGIVEIEQTQLDRLRQDQEKQIENTIQAIGLAVGTGAIFASSAGLIDRRWRMPWASDRSSYPHPFLIAVFGSFLLAGIVYKVVKCCQNRGHKTRKN